MIKQLPVYSGADATDHIQHEIDRLQEGDTLVIPEKATYTIDAVKGLDMKSGTTLQIDGVLSAQPNDQPGYAMLRVYDCANVTICGKGTLRGERWAHMGTTGEFGHCIEVLRAQHITIKELTLLDAWGDGIAVDGGKPEEGLNVDININGLKINGCRRQGISIICVNKLGIRNCFITAIGGTAPGDGIDLETDAPYKTIENVVIEGNVFKGTVGSNIAIGFEVGEYHHIYVQNNLHDFKVRPIGVSGNAGKLGEPAWAYALSAFKTFDWYRWWGYPTKWTKAD